MKIEGSDAVGEWAEKLLTDSGSEELDLSATFDNFITGTFQRGSRTRKSVLNYLSRGDSGVNVTHGARYENTSERAGHETRGYTSRAKIEDVSSLISVTSLSDLNLDMHYPEVVEVLVVDEETGEEVIVVVPEVGETVIDDSTFVDFGVEETVVEDIVELTIAEINEMDDDDENPYSDYDPEDENPLKDLFDPEGDEDWSYADDSSMSFDRKQRPDRSWDE